MRTRIHWAASLFALAGMGAGTWTTAAPDGVQYRNPILYSDYSDPDVIRVGSGYYMTASSFHFSPGLPLLESTDLVHWQLVGHALPRLTFDPKYDLPGPLGFSDGSERARFFPEMGHRYSAGVWAPSIRRHDGRFYIFFATPTEGIFMVSAGKIGGPWTAPVAVIGEPRLEDPCPFWDSNGKAYLIHSRVGAGPLILHRMSPDGTRVLDAGKVIVDDPANLPTLEGPKLLKRNGWYYIFAPYGGVEKGPQAVMRSKNIYGPYGRARARTGQYRRAGAAPGRLRRNAEWRGLVPAFQQHRRVWPHRSPAAGALGGRLAHDGRAHRGVDHHRSAGDVVRHAQSRQSLTAGIHPGH
jgi:hypothetical protein